jgi:NAD+ synthase
MKNNIEDIAKWLKDYCEKGGFKGYVLGLSGGIDSAVSLGLAVTAVGPERVRCIALPCTTSDEMPRPEDAKDAYLVAKTFGVRLHQKTLGLAADNIYNLIETPTKLVLPNIKARLRMVTLRAEAEALGYLVLGTTNKTEEYLGYYTKAGDGGAGVDIEPIADFFKYEIRELARELGVPDEIINKKPSAGLWFDQTDEDEIGFKYDDIDKYLRIREDLTTYSSSIIHYYITKSVLGNKNIKWKNISEFTKTNGKVMAAKIDDKLIDRVEKMIVSGNHKRNNPPFLKK